MTTYVRELVARLGFEVDQAAFDEWDANVARAREGVDRFVASLPGIGIAIAGSVAAATGELVHFADALGDAAVSTGLAADDLLAWQHVAEMSGSSAETMTAALERLPSAMQQAAQGSGAAAQAFARLGVSATDSTGSMRPAGEVFADLVAGLGGLDNAAERTALTSQLLGRRAGPELQGLLSAGSESIAAMRDEARSLYGDDLPGIVDASARVGDAVDLLGSAMRGLTIRFGEQVLPALAEFAEGLAQSAVATLEWIDRTGAARVALFALGGVMAAIAAASVVHAATTIAAWGPVLVAWSPMIATLAAVGGAIAVLALVADDLMTAFEGGESVFGETLDSLLGIGATAGLMKVLRGVWQQMSEDIGVLTGGRIRGLSDAIRWLVQFVVIYVGGNMIGAFLALASVVSRARREFEYWQAIASIWADRFVEVLARVMTMFERVRGAVSSVGGLLGIGVDVQQSVGVVPSSGAVAAGSTSNRSSRSVSVGEIIVQGITDPVGAAQEVRAHITSMLTDEVGIARQDTTPEVSP